MRKHFSNYIEHASETHDDLIFITGDLGYNALENLSSKLGNRFINAGVAEQGMMSMAAGMASQGYRVICYSIAPFVVYRCLEQIRNDVCFHNLPVTIVGNGGGYGYGIMGSSHHAIEDIACLSGLPNMTCYVPAFLEDMTICLNELFHKRKPSYLRLGLGKNMPTGMLLNDFGAGKVAETQQAGLTIIAQGPVVNNVFAALAINEYKENVDVFVVNKMPIVSLAIEIVNSINKTQKVLIVEEHISIGGLGAAISILIHELSLNVKQFKSLRAEGYPGALYGSQAYHQQLSGLDEKNISNVINSYF